MGIRETLGMGTAASWTYVGEYLRDQYIKNRSEMVRRDDARKRDAYYEGGGDEHIKRFIWLAFEDDLVRKLRADLVGQAKWNNVLKRVARELATVYKKPATRKIGGDDQRYKDFIDLVGQDAVMREIDRKLVIHDDVWVQYRVQRDTKKPVIDVVTPSMFWAVCSPGDRTQLMAIVLDQTPPRVTRVTPCFRVWTADETFMLDSECRVIVSKNGSGYLGIEKNTLGRLPGVLVSMRPATTKGQLLTESPAADLVAAHETIWFQNVLLVKESKSANKQTYVTGDTSAAAMGQSADTERENVLPEGVTVQAVDRGMDLSQFRDNADHVVERAAANYGLPPSVLHQRDASSGEEINLRRIPLRELREERVPVLRSLERELVQIQSAVNANDLPEFSFKPDGWTIDFGEVQQPMTEMEALQVFEKERELGFADNYTEELRRNPDIKNVADAMLVVDARTKLRTRYVKSQKELMAASGALGAMQPRTAFEVNRGEPEPETTDEEGAA